jgi:hypothetical protein
MVSGGGSWLDCCSTPLATRKKEYRPRQDTEASDGCLPWLDGASADPLLTELRKGAG